MRSEIKLLTQPVIEIEEDGVDYLECEKTELEVLQKMGHLAPALEVFRNACSKGKEFKYILKAPTRDAALQATAALSSILSGCDFCEEMKEEWTEEDQWTEDGQLWEFGTEEDEKRYRFMLLKQGDFAEEDVQASVMQNLMGNIQKDKTKEALQKTTCVFLECEKNVKNDLPELLSKMNKNIIVLWVKEKLINAVVLERLMFEQGFQIVQVKSPGMSYYVRLFKEYIELLGFSCPNQNVISRILEELIRYRNRYFTEKDIFRYVEIALENMRDRGGGSLLEADFCLMHIQESCTAGERLREMIGLREVKSQLEKICAARILSERIDTENTKQRKLYNHLAFAGAPGTGKSEAALAYAEILAEERVTSGAFVKADRSDIIGKYLGHTAPKIKRLFEQADGGVLFIDEAGSLTTNDEYTKEAVTELVRYMEECPQTTVIFATYPEKLEEFLNQDAGLRSRISRVVTFPSYTNDELLQILYLMVKEYGCKITKDCEPAIRNYLEQVRCIQGESFGNAREVRKLLDAAFRNYSVRALKAEKKTGRKPDYILRKKDIEAAAAEFMVGKRETRKIGFFQPALAGKDI